MVFLDAQNPQKIGNEWSRDNLKLPLALYFFIFETRTNYPIISRLVKQNWLRPWTIVNVPYPFTFQTPFTYQDTHGISPKEPLVSHIGYPCRRTSINIKPCYFLNSQCNHLSVSFINLEYLSYQ